MHPPQAQLKNEIKLLTLQDPRLYNRIYASGSCLRKLKKYRLLRLPEAERQHNFWLNLFYEATRELYIFFASTYWLSTIEKIRKDKRAYLLYSYTVHLLQNTKFQNKIW